ncbi:MAG: gliding motility-associated ABC transporter substrate-binding protein GldG [Flavobacteriales bacterium]|nr:gliding motility-associated ABC transporter substrate-binding protein GldG [Flavobacteriales bacterium]
MVRSYGNRTKSLYRTLVGIGIVILVVLLGSFLFIRWDLTEEKRHTLTPASVEMLEGLDDVVFVKVYLKGEYPAEFKKLEQAIRERLDEMKAYAQDNLEYEFINPSESEDRDERNELYQYLQDSGLQYTNITFQSKDGVSEKIIFPGALITYRNQTMPLQILKSNERAVDPQMINNSINNLEYEFAHIIRRIIEDKRPSIAFIQGHGESDRMETSDAEILLSESYNVTRVTIDGKLSSLSIPMDDEGKTRLNKYELLIISDPDSAFSDADRFMLDQFIMRGGKVIWAVDPLIADMDSLRNSQQTMAVKRELGIEEMLFQYGARLENNMLLDRSCAPIGITTGMMGNQPQIEMFPWYFKPVIVPRDGHPIVSNIDPVVTEFVSSIDTIARPEIKKTVLLRSSEFTRILRPPVRINLSIVSIDPDFGEKKRPYQPIAVLLEGRFESAFKNRISSTYLQEGFEFREKSVENSMLVISDGDIFRNRVSADGKNYFTLGFDRYAGRKIYGNREFLLNAVNYMLDESSLISVRNRTIRLRQLNQEIILEDRGIIQMTNVALPIVIIMILGGLLNWLRNKRYKQDA